MHAGSTNDEFSYFAPVILFILPDTNERLGFKFRNKTNFSVVELKVQMTNDVCDAKFSDDVLRCTTTLTIDSHRQELGLPFYDHFRLRQPRGAVIPDDPYFY